MYTLEKKYVDLLDENCLQGVLIEVTATDGTTTKITEDDIPTSGMTVDRYSVSGSTLEVGSAIAAELTLNLNNSDGKWDNFRFEGAEMYIQVRLYNEWKDVKKLVPLGYFLVDTPPRKRGSVKLTALDRMVLFDKEIEGLTFPMTVATMVLKCCDICGVPLGIDYDTLISYSNSLYEITGLPEEAETITYRTLIQWCAFLMGKCAYINYEGKLVFSWYTTPAFNLTLDRRYTSDIFENDLVIDGLAYQHTDSNIYKVGTCDYPVSYSGCALLQTEEIKVILSNIYRSVQNTTYRPFEMSCRPYPHIWPLDGIYITDTNGQQFSSLVTHVTYTLNGTTTIKATGLTATTSGYASASNFTYAQSAALKALLNSYYSGTNALIQEARKEASDAINAGGTNGIMSYGLNEMTATDTGNIETAKRVFKLNINGLGYGSDGADGLYDSIITSDGWVVGDRILANSITTAQLDVSIYETFSSSILDDVGKTYETISNVSTKFEALNGLISAKVSQIDFNSLSERVGSAESAITATADSLSAYVKTETYNDLAGRMETAESKIKATSDSLSSYVKTETYDSLAKKVATNESSISQNAKNIELKVASADFGTLIEQNSEHVRISWNKVSSYIQFENARLNIYGSDSKLLSSLGSSGTYFYYKGTATGFIGTSGYEADANRILSLALNSDATGLIIGSNNSSDTVTTKFLYANKTVSGVSNGFGADTQDPISGLTKDSFYMYGPLHMGYDLHMHSKAIINPRIQFINSGAALALEKQSSIGSGTTIGNGATLYLSANSSFTSYYTCKVINGIICSV
jgi:hypothetical protein